MFLRTLLTAFIINVAIPALSQVAPSATEGSAPLRVGVGFSDFYTEMIAQRMKGTAAWADWNFTQGPIFLHRLGIEAEGRNLNFGQPSSTRLRLITAGGGPIYIWRPVDRFHLYAKSIWEFGHMDFHIKDIPYNQDHWTIYSPGGGAEYRIGRNVWFRADYEYHFWRVGFFNNNFLNPRGFTFGASYTLRPNRK